MNKCSKPFSYVKTLLNVFKIDLKPYLVSLLGCYCSICKADINKAYINDLQNSQLSKKMCCKLKKYVL